MGTTFGRIRRYRTDVRPAGPVATVTGIELFFDVLTAFAFSQVDTYVLRQPTGYGFLHGALILAVIWGCWINYCWAANALRANVGILRDLHITALAAMTLLGLTLPLAFDRAGLHLRAVVFIACYLVIRLSSAVILRLAGGRPAARRAALVAAAGLVNTAMIAWSTVTGPTAQILLWCAALAVECLATVTFSRGWTIGSAEHLAERFGFIVTAGLEISLGRMAFGMLGQPAGPRQTALIAATAFIAVILWWLYFDLLSRYAERRLELADPIQRTRLAVVHYSLLHLAVVAGMLLFALALRTMGDGVYRAGAGVLGVPLAPVWAISLATGYALYAAAVAVMWRLVGEPLPWATVGAALAALASIPVLTHQPAVMALLLVGGLGLAAILVQYATGRQGRRRLLAIVNDAEATSAP